MSKTRVLEVLKSNGCISAYRADVGRQQLDWSPGGFQKAFEELKSNLKPFGLNKKERALLLIILASEDKTAVDDWVITSFKERHGL